MIATYFGLEVEVVVKMDCYSVIQFRGRKLIVQTADLVFRQDFKWAA